MDKNKPEDLIGVFLSLHSEYARSILDGKKTIELRRRFSNYSLKNRKLLIYSTSPIKKVIGYAVIKNVHFLCIKNIWSKYKHQSNISEDCFFKYFNGVTNGFAIELEDPVEFEEPISAERLNNKYGLTIPQSFRYLNKTHEELFNKRR